MDVFCLLNPPPLPKDIAMTDHERQVTYIMFVDQFDRLLEKLPVAPSRDHHLQHPEMIPATAVAYCYFTVRTSHDPFSPRGTTYNTPYDFTEFLPLPQLASAS